MESRGNRLWQATIALIRNASQLLVAFARHVPGAWAAFSRTRWPERITYYMLVPVLLLLSLWLPPISLRTRVFHLDDPLITPDRGGIVPGPAGARVEIPGKAVQKNMRMAMSMVTAGDVAGAKPGSPEATAAKSLPEGVLARGPWYRLEMRGQKPSRGVVSLPLPADLSAIEVADLYGWDGTAWRWLPSHPGESGLRAEVEQLPTLLMIAQSQLGTPRITMSASTTALAEAESSFINVGGFTPDAAGNVVGQPPDADALRGAGEAKVMLSITNLADGVVRSDTLDNLMADGTLRRSHAQKIVALATSGKYAGVEISYRGLDANLRTEFTAFVAELAQVLHAANRTLAVRVDAPTATNATWDTGGYDWRALGRSVDYLRIPALSDPAAYAAGGQMDLLIGWATGEVDRRKVDLVLSAYCQDTVGGDVTQLSYREALSLLAQDISADRSEPILLPGESLTVSLPKVDQGTLRLDGDAQVYWFRYQDRNGADHTVWLANASSVGRKLQWVGRYALGGITADGVFDEGSDQSIAGTVRAFGDNLAPPAPRFALVWSVADEAGKTIETRVAPLSDPKWQWTAPNNPGNYVIGAAVSDNGGETNLGEASKLGVQVPTPTFTPTPTPTNTPTPTPTPTNTPTLTPTPTRRPTATTAPVAQEEEGATERKEAPAAAPKQPAPPPAVPAGSARAGFGYGIQADLMSDGNHERIFGQIKGIGFNWVKQQIEWFRYNPKPGVYDWGAIDRLVDGANANGINVLLSVVKAPGWARPKGDTDQGPPADVNTYAAFVGAMAERYRGRVKAYEIWNEQNLYYEWGGKGHKLNAARYVELLRAAYNAIKSKDPGAVVVSGALTPTGWNDGDTAIDDRVYLEQMYQSGLARYCDAVGAHPSGYNNPPDADWTSYRDPTTGRAKGHPSWFFRGTMESYRNIMIKYGDGGKRIWPTEFGWASVEGLGVGPANGYEYAADNSEGEQAQFIVRAYQMGRSWGWVGPMFLWNLNFGPVSGARDEKAAFGIVRPDWSPRAAYAALRGMPK